MKRIILFLLLALSIVLTACGKDELSGDRDLGGLLGAIADASPEDEVLPAATATEHFKIKKRVAQYEQVESYKVELKDYLGEVFAKETTALTHPESMEHESCRLYRVAGEHNQLYLIKRDSEGEYSLWKFKDFATDFSTEEGKMLLNAYESVFSGIETDKADTDELRKLIYGAGHELLVSTTADENVAFQARSHLDHLRRSIGEGHKILGYSAEEQSALKMGVPYTLYSFNGSGEPQSEETFACPVLYDGAVVGLVSLRWDAAAGRYYCTVARSYAAALEELRFSEALDFSGRIVIAQVEDKVVATDGSRVVLLEDKIYPGRPSVTLETISGLAPGIYAHAAEDYKEVTRSLSK